MVLPLRWQRLCSCFFELWKKKKILKKKEGGSLPLVEMPAGDAVGSLVVSALSCCR